MCLYPKLIKNPKYRPNKKNNYKAPICEDERVLYVPVGCGNCIECRNQKKREWQTRMNEEIKHDNTGQFITLTFNNEELQKLTEETGIQESNAVATIAVRRFLERWRKKYKKSVKHWFVTELGHQGTERIHLHGIIFTKETSETIQNIWKYGNIWVGTFVNTKTINYIIKYITKIDEQHKGFKSIILSSAGIGKQYINRQDAQNNKYNGENTKETYVLPSGTRTALPIYYRNKIYTDEEREKLWINKLDKQERYVMGIKISVKKDENEYNKVLEQAQKDNERLGYGNRDEEWNKKEYNVTIRKLRKKKKIEEIKKKDYQNRKEIEKNDIDLQRIKEQRKKELEQWKTN